MNFLEGREGMSKPTIAVDFDGVIHRYSKGWKDGTIYDPPILGCKEALGLLSHDYRIIIYSTRNYDRVINGEVQRNQVEEVRQYLDEHRIPYDEIYTGLSKPICKFFIDDNAVRFEGNWLKTLSFVYTEGA